MTTAAALITRASDLLFDQGKVRWPEAELIRWINDAQRIIVGYRPDLAAVTENILLKAGAKQEMKGETKRADVGGTPYTQAIRVIEVTRNTHATYKNAIRITQMENLTAYNPDWATSSAASDNIKHYMFDESTPTVFWVYPPASGSYTAKVEVTYLAMPTEITTGASELSIPDTFFNAALDFVLFRAMTKDAEAGSLSARSQMYQQSFRSYFGDKVKIDLTVSPNLTNEGGAVPRQLRAGP